MTELDFKRAAELVNSAEVLVITAGAGMGVDSGLPDFRGFTGFWKAYPLYEKLGISFEDAANPAYFRNDPAFAWGFYGHRLNLYRATVPHQGFQILKKWISDRNLPYFIVTSNVDGQFQKAGFEESNILEIHGSIHKLQCMRPCTPQAWPNHEQIEVDKTCMRAFSLPLCPYCGGICRPNILMFEDASWIPERVVDQRVRFRSLIKEHRKKKIVIIEIGAGTVISNIRMMTEMLAKEDIGRHIIRINPRDAKIGKKHVALQCGALEAIKKLDELLDDCR